MVQCTIFDFYNGLSLIPANLWGTNLFDAHRLKSKPLVLDPAI